MDPTKPTEGAGRDSAPEPQYEMHAPLRALRADTVPLRWPQDYGLVASVLQDDHDLMLPPEQAIQQAAQVLGGVGHDLHDGDIMAAPDGTYYLYKQGTFLEKSGAPPETTQEEQEWWQFLAEHSDQLPTRTERQKTWLSNLETREDAIQGEDPPVAKEADPPEPPAQTMDWEEWH